MTGLNILALCVSGIATLIAASAATVSYLLYRSETDPEVLVYAEADGKRPSIINLVIENRGKGTARDVTFSWEGMLPCRAWGMSLQSAEEPGPMSEGPLVKGVPFLPPGGRRVISWGQYWGIYKGLGENKLEIRADYGSQHALPPRSRRHHAVCVLDITSFEATDDSDRNFDKKIAQNVEALKKAMESGMKELAHGLESLDATLRNTPESESRLSAGRVEDRCPFLRGGA